MSKQGVHRCVIVGAIALGMLPLSAGIASAQPPALPFVPGPPGIPFPGGYSYEIGTGSFTYPPHTTDTRGVRTSGPTADPTQTSTSMPNSKPGPAASNQTFWLNYSNARYGIQGGIVPPDTTQDMAQTPYGALPGMSANGGPWQEPLLESPNGTPPKTGVPTGEATNPTPPTYPQLEAPAQPAQPDQPAG